MPHTPPHVYPEAPLVVRVRVKIRLRLGLSEAMPEHLMRNPRQSYAALALTLALTITQTLI